MKVNRKKNRTYENRKFFWAQKVIYESIVKKYCVIKIIFNSENIKCIV